MNGLLAALGAVATGTGPRVLPQPRARFEPDEPIAVEFREEQLEVAVPPRSAQPPHSELLADSPPAIRHDSPPSMPTPPTRQAAASVAPAVTSAAPSSQPPESYVVAERTVETILERVDSAPPPLSDNRGANPPPSPPTTAVPPAPPISGRPTAEPTAAESISALIRWIEAEEPPPPTSAHIPPAASEPAPAAQPPPSHGSPAVVAQPLSAPASTPIAFADQEATEPLAPVINVAIDRLVLRQTPPTRPTAAESEGLRFAGPTLAEFLGERP